MNTRLMPLVISIITLGVISGVLLATVGASGDGSVGRSALDEPDGGGVAAACIEGTVDCNDTIGVPIDGGMNMCIEGVPDCNDMIDVPIDGGGTSDRCAGAEGCVDTVPPDGGVAVDPAGGPINQISVDFTADVTQADMDAVSEIIRSYDGGADVLILERFPPAASALVHHDSPNFCEEIVAQLEAANSVASASCAPYAPSPDDPDKPVSSDVPTSADDIPPDECNAVHNIDACSPGELEDLGLQPPTE